WPGHTRHRRAAPSLREDRRVLPRTHKNKAQSEHGRGAHAARRAVGRKRAHELIGNPERLPRAWSTRGVGNSPTQTSTKGLRVPMGAPVHGRIAAGVFYGQVHRDADRPRSTDNNADAAATATTRIPLST